MMKKVIPFGFALLVLAGTAGADTTPVKCFKKARAELSASDLIASSLCSAAESDAPVECYKTAYSKTGLDLNSGESARLCKKATSDAPLECFKLALKELHLGEYVSTFMCSGAQTARGPIECYKEAYPKWGLDLYSDEALTLCGAHFKDRP